jgi:NAD(P)-dependent dehydrogenase (short-subunit alcohol dehydrogenase family)
VNSGSFITYKTHHMLLQQKNAVIYGAGGSLGGAVARALAAAGAKVYLTGRSLGSVQKVAIDAGGDDVREFIEKMANDTMLKRMPPMQDIANTAVFLSSHMAASITGVTIDVTAGTTSALNYKVTNIAFLKADEA